MRMRLTQNRLIVGVLTVVLAASTAAAASSVERNAGVDATQAAGAPAGTRGGGSGSPPAAGFGEPSPPSATSASSGFGSNGASTPVGAPVPAAPPPEEVPAAPPPEETGEIPDPSGPGEEVPAVDAAVVTPLLRTLAFGTNFAVRGVACNLGGSVVGSVTTELGLSELASSAILDGVDACMQLAATSIAVLEQLTEASTALSAVNPAVDPLLEILATNVEILGTRYAEQLAPLGETLATLGPTIRYLIGGNETDEGER